MKDFVKANHTLILALVCLLSFAGVAGAQEDIADKAMKACQPEIESFCSQVTPGDGRLLACFMAHEDKLSGKCGWALYEAMDELEEFMNAVAYLADACWDDLVKHCSEVQMGEGRVAKCLLDHEGEVSGACKQGIKDVELEVVEE